MTSSPPEDPPIHLGFAEPLSECEVPPKIAHESPNWSEWDGGQIGGLVSWLDPQHIPKSCLKCRTCSTPVLFLCQLYAPADAVNPQNAFHRTLYVFGCPKCCASDSLETTDCLRVLRSQLPKDNPYYPETIDSKNEEFGVTWKRHTPQHWKVDVCAVCGQRSRGACPKQQLPFCGPHHQKEHYRNIFVNRNINGSSGEHAPVLPSVLCKSELVVEEEPAAVGAQDENAEPSTMFSAGEEDEDSDLELTQEDLNAMTGATNRLSNNSNSDDPLTNVFRARVHEDRPNVQDQVVRYQQWPPADHDDDTTSIVNRGPLWIRSDYVPPDGIPPPCPCCGAPRKFEFQIMPQLLHYLWKDWKENTKDNSSYLTPEAKQALLAASEVDLSAAPEAFEQTHKEALRNIQNRLLHQDQQMDWGVVTAYTCTSSCGKEGQLNNVDEELGSYREEYAWRQPPLGL